jgi:hypothetical protein
MGAVVTVGNKLQAEKDRSYHGQHYSHRFLKQQSVSTRETQARRTKGEQIEAGFFHHKIVHGMA